MRETARKLCLLGLLAVAVSGCIDHEGQLAVLMSVTSADGGGVAAQQVNLEVTSVDLREADSGAYLTLTSGSQVYELLAADGKTSVLALSGDITEGDYTHVRLTFSEVGSFVINDQSRRRPLRIEPLTLEVPVLATVVEDATVELILDLDVDASLTVKGNGEFWLRPVIRQTGLDF